MTRPAPDSKKYKSRPRKRRRHHSHQALRFEPLEPRQLLSVSPSGGELSDAPALMSSAIVAAEGLTLQAQAEILSAKQAAGELRPGEAVIVNDLGQAIGYDPLPAEAIDDVGDFDNFGAAIMPGEDDLPDQPGTASFDIADTFLLHSNPGAAKTIYLDFDGHTTVDISWSNGNEIVTPAFTFEGYDTSFTDNELIRIQQIWERVAEDFIPFDVDVTTEEPPIDWLEHDYTASPTDDRWGVRVVLGGNSSWSGGSYYGLGLYHSFGWTRDTPCFVFTGGTGSNASKIASIASHEIGHTMGLYHDGTTTGQTYYNGGGTGDTAWAPIMGGGWNQPLSQWSKGEYNNANQLQDDLDLIANSATTSIGYRTDAVGGDILSASPLVIQPDATIFDAGIIELRSDLDFFSFSTLAGTVNLDIDPFYASPNLDILATLYDSNGTVITTSNPADYLYADISETLVAGDYYVSIEGVGDGIRYNDYASLGRYTIKGNVITPAVMLTESDGDTLVSEGQTIDTYDVALVTVPAAGSVEITATADTQTELSLDGIVYSNSVVFSRVDTTSQTIYIRAIDDAVLDVIDTSTITHVITATGDATDYPLSLEIFDLGLDVQDDEATHIIDDAEAGFAASSNFTHYPDPYNDGYKLDYHTRELGTGSAEASWTFTDLSDGNYRVSTLWLSHENRAIDTPYSIENGGGVVLATKAINQQLEADDFTDAGGIWEDLAIVSATDGTLLIKLTDAESGNINADAVRIERLGGITEQMSMDIVHADISENGGSTTGTVMRTGNMVGDLTVMLSSDDTSEATVPASVVILDGQAIATFTITAVDDPYIDSARTVNITSSASGYANVANSLQVTDDEPAPPPMIIDDGDPEFTQTNFIYDPTPLLTAYETDRHYNDKNTGFAEATWTFTDLSDGEYRVSATYRERYNQATDAPYTLENGNSDILATATIDQKIRPDDLIEDGTKWEDLAYVTISDGTLVVILNESPGGIGKSVADAIRVELIAETIFVAPPQVTGVFVAGSSWTDPYLDSLDLAGQGHPTISRLGYAVPVGSGADQLAPLPWSNANQLSFVFDQDVVVAEDDLSVTGINLPTYNVTPGGFSYDPLTYTATWTLDTAPTLDTLTITLESDALSGIRSVSGVALDGEWDNPTDLTDPSSDTFNSGDDSAGGDFEFHVSVRQGDTDQDGDVDLDDVIAAVGSFTGPGGSGKTFPNGDTDGDADVDLDDIITMVGAFTGPMDSAAALLQPAALSELAAAAATDAVFAEEEVEPEVASPEPAVGFFMGPQNSEQPKFVGPRQASMLDESSDLPFSGPHERDRHPSPPAPDPLADHHAREVLFSQIGNNEDPHADSILGLPRHENGDWMRQGRGWRRFGRRA